MLPSITSKYMRQILVDFVGEIDNPTTLDEDFNTFSQKMIEWVGRKISKDIDDQYNNINQFVHVA